MTCSRCGVEKSLEAFCKTKSTRSGYQNPCKACYNLEKRGYRNANYDRLRAERKALNGTTGLRELHRRATVKHRYGITQDQYLAMVEAQHGVCLICQEKPDKLCIDHCHKTGRIRGLLCRKCNLALGHMDDDPVKLVRASQYITSDGQSHRVPKVQERIRPEGNSVDGVHQIEYSTDDGL